MTLCQCTASIFFCVHWMNWKKKYSRKTRDFANEKIVSQTQSPHLTNSQPCIVVNATDWQYNNACKQACICEWSDNQWKFVWTCLWPFEVRSTPTRCCYNCRDVTHLDILFSFRFFLLFDEEMKEEKNSDVTTKHLLAFCYPTAGKLWITCVKCLLLCVWEHIMRRRRRGKKTIDIEFWVGFILCARLLTTSSFFALLKFQNSLALHTKKSALNDVCDHVIRR